MVISEIVGLKKIEMFFEMGLVPFRPSSIEYYYDYSFSMNKRLENWLLRPGRKPIIFVANRYIILLSN